MSMPNLPENINITRENAVNLILASIAMEELGLSHIMNAEGEKLQYALGTLEGTTGLTEPAKIDDLLNLNKSVRDTLSLAMQNQLFMSAKMNSAMSMPTMVGPTGPTGPTGRVGVILASYNSLDDLIAEHATGNQGDAYLVNGDLYVWNPDSGQWGLVGNLQGPNGPQGPPGPRGLDGPEGAAGPQGEQGIQGEAGIVGTIRGSYESEQAMRDDHPEGGELGEFYYINPDLWVWDDVNGDWINVGQIAGPQGIQGVQGERGEAGPTGPTGAMGTIQGSYDTVQDLEQAHPLGNQGESYLVGGDLYVWNTDTVSWERVGSLLGPTGPTGPAGASGATTEAYNFNLSATGSAGEATVGNIIFRLANVNNTSISLYIRAVSPPVQIDFARSTFYNFIGSGAIETLFLDNYALSAQYAADATTYSQSNEQQKSWLRQQNQDGTWSLCEYSVFSSANGARTTLWINWIYRNLLMP